VHCVPVISHVTIATENLETYELLISIKFIIHSPPSPTSLSKEQVVKWHVCNPTYPLAIFARVSSVLTEIVRDITQSVPEDSALLYEMGPKSSPFKP
jgi:hypothetical protein